MKFSISDVDSWFTAAPDQVWYLDAWAPFDGYAFASLRPAGSIGAAVTFFLAPPYFEPEPVATLATALAATRGCFQEGWHDANGHEVAFASLDQVIETVRRMYRAGGLDLNGPAPSSPAQPHESSPGEVFPSDLVDGEMQSAWKHARLDGGAEQAWRLMVEHALLQLVPKFVGASVLDVLSALTLEDDRRSGRAGALLAWLRRAAALGIDIVPDHGGAGVVVAWRDSKVGFSWPAAEYADVLAWLAESSYLTRYGGTATDASAPGLPLSIPLPFAFQANTRRAYAPIRSLGQLYAAATADVFYLRSIQGPEEAVPLIVLALLNVSPAAQTFVAFPPRPGSPESARLVDAAARWLVRTLPSAVLSGHPAEILLHETVVRRLRHDTDENLPLSAASHS